MRRKSMSVRQRAEAAAHHNSTLNIFAAVIALMEGGLIYDADAEKTAMKLIELCWQEMHRQLHKMDVALDELAAGVVEKSDGK